MAPKSKKSSYVIFGDMFNLTHWNGAMSLKESPSLTYRPHDHLLESARTGLVSFSNFSHFWGLLWSLILICFWICKCLGFLWDEFWWKYVWKCRRTFLCLCSCVCGYRLAYAACIHAHVYMTHAYAGSLHAYASSLVYTDTLSNLRTRVVSLRM